jgi:hypothetical protein
VVTFATGVGLLLVATSDGTVVRFEYDYAQSRWAEVTSYPGDPVTALGYDGQAVVQRGRDLESIRLDPSDCRLALTLAPGERLAGADAGRVAILAGRSFRVIPGCGGPVIARGTASSFSLDSNHFVTAEGRRVTRYQLPGS